MEIPVKENQFQFRCRTSGEYDVVHAMSTTTGQWEAKESEPYNVNVEGEPYLQPAAHPRAE